MMPSTHRQYATCIDDKGRIVYNGHVTASSLQQDTVLFAIGPLHTLDNNRPGCCQGSTKAAFRAVPRHFPNQGPDSVRYHSGYLYTDFKPGDTPVLVDRRRRKRGIYKDWTPWTSTVTCQSFTRQDKRLHTWHNPPKT